MDHRIAVAIPLNGPHAQALLVRASQLARLMNVPWAAFLVRTQHDRIAHLPEDERLAIVEALNVAANLGGVPICCDADDVPMALLELARRERVRLLILGSSTRSGFLQRLIPGTTERLLRADRDFDVIITSRGLTL